MILARFDGRAARGQEHALIKKNRHAPLITRHFSGLLKASIMPLGFPRSARHNRKIMSPSRRTLACIGIHSNQQEPVEERIFLFRRGFALKSILFLGLGLAAKEENLGESFFYFLRQTIDEQH
jgi:hypothetical protein